MTYKNGPKIFLPKNFDPILLYFIQIINYQ